ncbi:short-chain dehydrogenases/reductase [Mytilinidion resinicola]|uniref:Short-chain dehydrogenases/reductase n=1 Tax=Mytilinidion resinicola TaxID=574789 RepID=A0A6A6YUD8_9PEZI|nr:short-chain dehydrogenases/reductase [Mytilinidion resinicola]KAF2812003.1 short-chain dehydrogenases/reductase [Mytilinidion resinicola]
MPSYIVVGASRGLGYAWLQNLSASPSNTVVGLVRTPTPVIDQLASDKISNVRVLPADMTDPVSLSAAAAEVSKLTNGSVDYLIVNGAYQNHPVASLTPTAFIGKEELLREEMRTHVDVNLTGVMFAINAFLPLVRQSSIKKIIVLTSGLADLEGTKSGGLASAVVYSALKAALNMVVLKYSIELKEEGVVFLALSPGVINTRLDTPSEEDLASMMAMMQKFQAHYPHWTGPMKAEESVAMMKDVIEKVTIEESGEFLSHKGNKEWL